MLRKNTNDCVQGEHNDEVLGHYGEKCEGDLKYLYLFGKDKIKIPLCERHFTMHLMIIMLSKNGVSMEDLVSLGREKIEKLFEKKLELNL